MASKQAPGVGDTIESTELTTMQLPHGSPSLKGPEKVDDNVTGTSPEVIAETVQQRSTFRTFTVMAALFTTLFIGALNITVVATAVPTICSDLDSASGYAWIGAAYVIASSACSPIWAKVSDIWGRKPILLIGVAIYFASSIICATSSSMSMLIAGRALQGVGAGGFMTLINIVVSDLFSMRCACRACCVDLFLLTMFQESSPLPRPAAYNLCGCWRSWSSAGRCIYPAAIVEVDLLDQPSHLRTRILPVIDFSGCP